MQALFSGSDDYFFRCPRHGDLVSLSFLGRFAKAAPILNQLLAMQRHPLRDTPQKEINCPKCQKKMLITPLANDSTYRVDQCISCQEVWFDVGELNSVKQNYQAGGLLATPRVDEVGHFQYPLKNKHRIKMPSQYLDDSIGVDVPDIFDLLTPYGVGKQSQGPIVNKPIGTIVLIGILFMFTYTVLKSGDHLLNRWVFFPEQPWRSGGSTLVWSLFVNLDWQQSIGNAYFLWLWGSSVEDKEGTGFLMLLFLFSGIGGTLFYLAQGLQIPSLGSSGALCGVLCYYVIAFPKDRITIVLGGWKNALRFSLPGPAMAGIFIIHVFLYTLIAKTDPDSFINTDVEFWTCFGGALVGLLAYLIKTKGTLDNR
jgi:membrane associated rhomboid family serine protease